MFYVYRFLNKQGECIYIGRAKDLETRIYKQHFSGKGGHLPGICYLETDKVEYLEFKKEVDMLIYEIYLINKVKPKYNSRDKTEETPSIELEIPNWKYLRGFKKRSNFEKKIYNDMRNSKDIFKVRQRFREADEKLSLLMGTIETQLNVMLSDAEDIPRVREHLISRYEKTKIELDEILGFDVPIIM